MDDKIRAIVCLCDALLQAMPHQADRQCQMPDAAIMTTAGVASLCLRGHHASARVMLQQHGDIPPMVSQSRWRRRRHRLTAILLVFFNLLAQTWQTRNAEAISVLDSFTLAVCDNMRMRRSKIYSHDDFRGYPASKKRYFDGRTMPLMVPQDGQPVACVLTPGGWGEVDALPYDAYELPDGATLYAEKASHDYELADLVQDVDHIQLLPIRKQNSHSAWSPALAFVQSSQRQRVETAGSLSAQLVPKSMHAVTS